MRNCIPVAFCCALILFNTAFAQQDSINWWLHRIDTLGKNRDSSRAYMFTRVANFSQVKNLKQAIYYSYRAIETAQQVKDKYPSLLVEAYSQQASNYLWKNNYDTSLQLYYKAIEIVNSYNVKNQLSYLYDGMADLYTETGMMDKALKYCRMALDISEKENDKEQMMYAYHAISGVYRDLRNYAGAEKYTRDALILFRKNDNQDRVAACYMDIARLYTMQDRNDEAIPLLDSAVYIFKKLEEPIQIAEADELYGAVYTKKNDFDKVDRYFNEALQIYERDSLTEDKYRVYLGIANAFYLRKNYQKTKSLLTEADNWFRENDSDELHLQSLFFLAKTDSALGIAVNAFSYLQEYRELSERIHHKKQELQTRQMLIEYDVASKVAENLHLKKQNQLAREEIFIFIIAGILLVITLIVTLFMFFQKKKVNRQLVVSQHQTEDINKQLEQSNQVKNQLFSILAHDLRSPMSNTLHLLQMTKTGEISFEQFRQMGDMLEADLVYNNQLLENMLSWAKSQMEGIVLHKKKINLAQPVAENVQLFQSIANRKEVTVKTEIPKHVMVNVDENILRLALRNSISNALKFSEPRKSILIKATEREGKILLQVIDEGVGMTQQQLKNLFSLNVSSTTGTKREKGVGLGLKITKEMMDKMEASFWIESKAGTGTTVNMLMEKA